MWVDWFGRSVPVDMGGLTIRFDGREATVAGNISGRWDSTGGTVGHGTIERDILREQLLGLSDRVGAVVPAHFDDAHLGLPLGDHSLRGWWRIVSSGVDVVGPARAPGTSELRWSARFAWVGSRPHRWFDVAVRDEAFGNNVPGYQAAWGYPASTSGVDGEIVYIDRDQGARQLPTGFIDMTPALPGAAAAFPAVGVPPTPRVVRVDQLTAPAQLAYARVGSLRWDAEARDAMNGACYVASVDAAGVAHPTSGRTVAATRTVGATASPWFAQTTPSSWELGSGLIRFRQSATAGRINVEWFVGGAWTNLRSLSFGTGAAVAEWRGVQVVRNTHEAATIRLVAADRRGGSVEITVIRGRVGAYLQVDTPPGDPATAGLFVSLNTGAAAGLEHGLISGPVTLIGRGNAGTPTYTITVGTGTIANAVSATQRLFAISCGGVAGFPSATASREELRSPLVLRESVTR